MAFTSTKTGFEITGKYKVKYYSWVATGVTSGTIKHGILSVKTVIVTNTTGERAATAVDYTSTAGTVAISGLTSGDAGLMMVVGK